MSYNRNLLSSIVKEIKSKSPVSKTIDKELSLGDGWLSNYSKGGQTYISPKAQATQFGQYKRGGGFFPEYHSFTPPREQFGGMMSRDNGGWLDEYQHGGTKRSLDPDEVVNIVNYMVDPPGKSKNPQAVNTPPINNNLQTDITKIKPLTPANTREKAVAKIKNAEEFQGLMNEYKNNNDEVELKERIKERQDAQKARHDVNYPFTFPTGETKKYNDMDWREKRYVGAKSLEADSRFKEGEESWWDTFNPLHIVGDMAAGLGEAPYTARQTNSNTPYITSILSPILFGRTMGSGSINPISKKFWTKDLLSNKQFLHSIANPAYGLGLNNIIKKPFNSLKNGINDGWLNQYQQGGIITDPRGQWAHPGKNTRIPGSNITMQGVPYPVFGVGSNGQQQMMYPGQEYQFGGAEYVDEYPILQKGGNIVPPIKVSNPNDPRLKAYSDSLSLYNNYQAVRSELNNLKPVVFGVAGQESTFNTTKGLASLKDVAGDTLDLGNSKGLFQIKFDSLTEKEKKVLKINKPNDLLDDTKAYQAAILLMHNAKKRMDHEVEQGTHPQLVNADPYFRAAYYYNSPARAISTAEKWAKGSNPVVSYNPSTWLNKLSTRERPGIFESVIPNYVEQAQLRMDKGSYPYKLMEQAKDLKMHVNEQMSNPSTLEEIVIPARSAKAKKENTTIANKLAFGGNINNNWLNNYK